jgi:hypothetical protein
MGSLRVLFAALLTLAAFSAFGQDWQTPYQQGLEAASKEQWAVAREAFLKANGVRRGDISAPTPLPGPPTERRRWRNGAAYSPRFLAAYSAYRQALLASGEEQRGLFAIAAGEMQPLVNEGEAGPEAFYFLNLIYGRLGEQEKRKALDAQFLASKNAMVWRVDSQVISPEDMALIRPEGGTAQPFVTSGAGGTLTVIAGAPTPKVVAPGAVPTLENKFALIIGNSEGGGLPFAVNDANKVRDALLLHAGYAEGNVVTLTNASADQMREAAEKLGARVPAEGSVLIYFAGRGEHAEGKDYLAGADQGDAVGAMLPKSELLRPLVTKGARIFAFYETSRTVNDDSFFGKEALSFGSVAQMQSTMPGGPVERTVRDGVEIGVFTDAFISVLSEMRSNQIPIMEFGWQVFYRVRRGASGTTGGGSRQTPTLPSLSNMASDSRF